MGNITGAMVFQSTIPTVVALLFASSAWVATQGSYIAFASAGIAFLSMGAIFIPMARTGRLRGRGLLVGGVFYVGLPGARRRRSSGASSARTPGDRSDRGPSGRGPEGRCYTPATASDRVVALAPRRQRRSRYAC